MTTGLGDLADDRLRGLLGRATRSPAGGALTGAVATAALQSSSATTVAAIGFVSAGLMSFTQALGIIFGANIGTTITGWLVALVGFKLKLGTLLLPMILVGVILQLTSSRSQRRGLGNAIAGFGLIFVGLDILQAGMSSFSDVLTPESFPPDTLIGRMLLLLIGLVMTVVTQSSSAGVAIALTAVNVGTISLSQAAAMVIGMDVGTTITALIATIGGTLHAKRTGWSHVIYNMLTGIAAFILLTPYLSVLSVAIPGIEKSDPEIALVGFHSFFNLIGVIVILPFTKHFAELIIRLVPEQGNPLLHRLDSKLKNAPELSVAAAEATARDLVSIVFTQLNNRMVGTDKPAVVKYEQVDEAIRATQAFINSVNLESDKQQLYDRQQSAMHILDHLRRLMVRLSDQKRVDAILSMAGLDNERIRLAVSTKEIAAAPESVNAQSVKRYRADYEQLKKKQKAIRRESIAAAVRGDCDVNTVGRQTNATRSFRRMGYHFWRIVVHLHKGGTKVDPQDVGPAADVSKPD